MINCVLVGDGSSDAILVHPLRWCLAATYPTTNYMSEAWFLHDEQAIRRAAGNPNGKVMLNLPNLGTLSTLIDPKETLIQLLRTATGNNRRRLKRFNVRAAIHRVAEFIEDYSPLRAEPSFRKWEDEIDQLRRLDFARKEEG